MTARQRVFHVHELDEEMRWSVSELHTLPSGDIDAESLGIRWYADDAFGAVMLAAYGLEERATLTTLIALPVKRTFILTFA